MIEPSTECVTVFPQSIKGTKLAELSAVLDFMYHGEVNIEQKNLEKFLETACDLKIKGLSQDTMNEP